MRTLHIANNLVNGQNSRYREIFEKEKNGQVFKLYIDFRNGTTDWGAQVRSSNGDWVGVLFRYDINAEKGERFNKCSYMSSLSMKRIITEEIVEELKTIIQAIY